VPLAAISVDLDEIHHYFSIYGLPLPSGAAGHAVYDIAIDRLEDFARSHDLPLTLFAVAADMARPENAARLRRASEHGHEIGNHTLDHLYDLTRRSREEMVRQVESAVVVLEGATGQRPIGFRAPGYTVNQTLLDVLVECSVGYDSSVFPCPAYYFAKASALAAIRLRGRRSHSVLDTPAVLTAPVRPYRIGEPYWRRGSGLLELPIQVTRGLRLPYIGTFLTLPGPDGARLLTRGVIGEPLVNIELHGIDFLDAGDGLEQLRSHQMDVRVPLARKLAALSAVVETLRRAGYSFVRLGEAAERVEREAA
jgi:peptidoglycan-N-acetylglucosamine deacetylase